MPKVVPNRRYSAEFKVKVIETMRAEGLNYSEAGRRFGIESHTLLQIWAQRIGPSSETGKPGP